MTSFIRNQDVVTTDPGRPGRQEQQETVEGKHTEAGHVHDCKRLHLDNQDVGAKGQAWPGWWGGGGGTSQLPETLRGVADSVHECR